MFKKSYSGWNSFFFRYKTRYMNKRFLLFAVFSLVNAIAVRSQNDTTRIKEIIKEISTLISTDLPSSRRKAQECVAISKTIANKKFLYQSTLVLADVYYFNDEEDSVIKALEPLLSVIPKEVDERTLGGIYYRLAGSYTNLFLFEKGLEFNLKALAYFERIKDSTKVVNALVNTATIYQQQGNFKEVSSKYKKAEGIAKLLKKKTALGNVYNSWSILYAENNNADSALYYALASVKIREALNDQTSIVWNYNNLGGIYMMKEDWNKSKRWYEKAMKRFEETENYSGQSTVYSNLAEINLRLNNYTETQRYLLLSRQLFQKMNNPDLLENLYRNYMVLYTKQGYYEKANVYADSLITFKDSLFNNTLTGKLTEMQTKFDVEKKDLEIASTKIVLENTKWRNTVKNMIIAGILLVFTLLGFLAYGFYKRKKVEQEASLNETLAKQKEMRAKAIIEAEEKERVRIARDLHDGVGQLLSVTKLNLSQLESQLQKKAKESETTLKNVMSLLDDSMKEIRSVSHNMIPVSLLKLGLASAVREFVSRMQGSPTLKINLEIVGLENRLPQEKETILYRVIQELVNNIIKHAQAKEIGIQLICSNGELTLVIEDNGVGFDTSRQEQQEGIGIKNIISRVEYINGKVFFDSTPGKGTTVVVEVLI
jgi:two-component system, NarL family, sensor kinase